MEKAKGIDVSHWQGRIDFDKVKSQGYSFVMINAGTSVKKTKISRRTMPPPERLVLISAHTGIPTPLQKPMHLRKRKLFLNRSKARSLNIPSPLILRTLPKANFQTLP